MGFAGDVGDVGDHSLRGRRGYRRCYDIFSKLTSTRSAKMGTQWEAGRLTETTLWGSIRESEWGETGETGESTEWV